MKLHHFENLTARDWIRAVSRDGFALRPTTGSHHKYKHPDGRRVLLIYHKHSDTYGPKFITYILGCTGWKDADLKRLGLIK